YDGRLLRVSERHLDDLDPEQRGIRVLVRGQLRAPRQLGGRAHPRRPGDVDVHVLLVVGIFDHGVRVRPAAGLYVADVFRVGDVGEVEDADPAQPQRADRVMHAFRAAVEPAGVRLSRAEGEALVDGDVRLCPRA